MQIRLILLLMVLGNLLVAQQTKLISLGPPGGVITHLTGSLNDDVLFAVARGNGLYRSVDGGENWNKITSINLNFQNFSIGEITMHPVSSNIVLMATSLGLYRSEDKGITWSPPPAPPSVSPTHSVEYAPANPSILFGSDDHGVLRSDDGGKSWFALKDNIYFRDRPINKIAIHPADSANIRVIVSTSFNDTTGLFFTTNGGLNWKPFNKNLPQGAARRIYALELDSTGLPKKDFRAVVGTADGIYAVQTDYADTAWMAVKSSSVSIGGVITGGVLVYNKYDTLAAANDRHKFSFYFSSNASEFEGKPMPTTGQNGLWKIDSRLNSIVSISPFSQPPLNKVFNGLSDIMSIFCPYRNNKGKVYIGTSAGIYISNDTGSTWKQKNNGINQTAIRNLVSMQQTPLVKPLFAGTYGGGVLRSMNEGITWDTVNTGLTNPYVTALGVDRKRNYLYAGTVYTLYRSTNFGNSWKAIFNIDPSVIVDTMNYFTRNNDMTIRVSLKNPDFIMLQTKAYGLRLSKDGGISWSPVQSPLPKDSVNAPEHIEFDPIDSLTIYYAGTGLHKSTDLGQTWSNITGNIPMAILTQAGNRTLTTISPTINPKNNKEILLPSVFNQVSGFPYKVFKTTNGGTRWDTLPIAAYDVIYDSFDDKKLAASGPFGIFGSEDGGSNWKYFDTVQANNYLLIDAHATNQNVLFIGSESGAHRLEFLGSSNLTIDTADYYFGSLLSGKDSVRMIAMNNKTGTRKVLLQFVSLTDSIAFRYLGPRQFEILPGGEIQLPVRFVSTTAGPHKAQLNFITNDNVLTQVTFTLSGHSYTRYAFEKFIYDFGSVTVGKDSTISILIDNKEGLKSVSISYLGKAGDTASFNYIGAKTFSADSGATVPISMKFSARSVGEKVAYIRFSTSDARFPIIQYRLQGVGVAKNFMARKILIDSSVSPTLFGGMNIAEYYKILSLSLRMSDIAVQYQKSGSFDSYNALVIVNPASAPPSEIVDSLQRYVNNGGTLVLIGDYGSNGNQYLTSFLDDAGWETKFKTKTGIRFNSNLLFDSTYADTVLAGIVIAKPSKPHLYTYGVDSVVTLLPSSLTIDTSLRTVEPLLTAKSNSLFSIGLTDSVLKKLQSAIISATAKIGKGRIIAIADAEIWWNGIPDDTTKPLGVFGGKNLQFAVNIFGLIDNLLALLEPTPQEAYEMLSIPYAFSDSSVEALFKDLGKPNKLLWRMFGKYNQRNGYAEFPDDFKMIKRGEGYWLIAKNPVSMNLGTTTVQGTEEDFEIVLHSGYNMIGNPFPYKVSWKNSFKADSVENVLWSYHNGKYDSVTLNMEPFHGYWVKNRGTLSKIIRINSLLVTDNTALPKNEERKIVLEPNEWKIQISAQTSQRADDGNFVGVLQASVDELDDHDFSEPPTAPDNYISISIKNPKGRLAADYRAYNSEGNYWDFDVTSSEANIPVTISLAKFGIIQPNFKIYLLDNKQERVYDMSNSEVFQFALEKNETNRSFRFIVGSQNFIEKNSNGIPIVPIAYSLSQNYPNPFNPVTTIQYSVSHSGIVTLEVFNVLGQKIRTLVNGFQPIGSYNTQWNGKNDLSSQVSSGIYYYRVHINEFSSVKKMTFIK